MWRSGGKHQPVYTEWAKAKAKAKAEAEASTTEDELSARRSN